LNSWQLHGGFALRILAIGNEDFYLDPAQLLFTVGRSAGGASLSNKTNFSLKSEGLAEEELTIEERNMTDKAEHIAWAAKAIAIFQQHCRTDDENAIADLICDLGHLAEERGCDFVSEVRARD
jgi:hypothetical protein